MAQGSATVSTRAPTQSEQRAPWREPREEAKADDGSQRFRRGNIHRGRKRGQRAVQSSHAATKSSPSTGRTKTSVPCKWSSGGAPIGMAPRQAKRRAQERPQPTVVPEQTPKWHLEEPKVRGADEVRSSPAASPTSAGAVPNLSQELRGYCAGVGDGAVAAYLNGTPVTPPKPTSPRLAAAPEAAATITEPHSSTRAASIATPQLVDLGATSLTLDSLRHIRQCENQGKQVARPRDVTPLESAADLSVPQLTPPPGTWHDSGDSHCRSAGADPYVRMSLPGAGAVLRTLAPHHSCQHAAAALALTGFDSLQWQQPPGERRALVTLEGRGCQAGVESFGRAIPAAGGATPVTLPDGAAGKKRRRPTWRPPAPGQPPDTVPRTSSQAPPTADVASRGALVACTSMRTGDAATRPAAQPVTRATAPLTVDGVAAASCARPTTKRARPSSRLFMSRVGSRPQGALEVAAGSATGGAQRLFDGPLQATCPHKRPSVLRASAKTKARKLTCADSPHQSSSSGASLGMLPTRDPAAVVAPGTPEAVQPPGGLLRLLSPWRPDHTEVIAAARWTALGWVTWSYAPAKSSWVYRKRTALPESHLSQALRASESVVARAGRDNSQALPPAAWFTTASCTCVLPYGGQGLAAQPMPQWQLDLWMAISAHVLHVEQGHQPNAVRLQLLSSKDDHAHWQSEDAAILGNDDAVKTVVLGGTRRLQLRDLAGDQRHRTLMLEHGTLVAMHGLVQRHYQHRVPTEMRQHFVGPTTILTWLWIKRHSTINRCPAIDMDLAAVMSPTSHATLQAADVTSNASGAQLPSSLERSLSVMQSPSNQMASEGQAVVPPGVYPSRLWSSSAAEEAHQLALALQASLQEAGATAQRLAEAECRLAPVLEGQNATRQKVTADGTCQFASFSCLLAGDESSHAMIREAAMAVFECAQDHYGQFLGRSEKPEAYLARMAGPHAWGDAITLQIIIDILGTPVTLLTDLVTMPLLQVRPLGTFDLDVLEPLKDLDPRIRNAFWLREAAQTAAVELRLAYIAGWHYDAVIAWTEPEGAQSAERHFDAEAHVGAPSHLAFSVSEAETAGDSEQSVGIDTSPLVLVAPATHLVLESVDGCQPRDTPRDDQPEVATEDFDGASERFRSPSGGGPPTRPLSMHFTYECTVTVMPGAH